jgi:hypothetical protein
MICGGRWAWVVAYVQTYRGGWDMASGGHVEAPAAGSALPLPSVGRFSLRPRAWVYIRGGLSPSRRVLSHTTKLFLPSPPSLLSSYGPQLPRPSDRPVAAATSEALASAEKTQHIDGEASLDIDSPRKWDQAFSFVLFCLNSLRREHSAGCCSCGGKRRSR